MQGVGVDVGAMRSSLTCVRQRNSAKSGGGPLVIGAAADPAGQRACAAQRTAHRGGARAAGGRRRKTQLLALHRYESGAGGSAGGNQQWRQRHYCSSQLRPALPYASRAAAHALQDSHPAASLPFPSISPLLILWIDCHDRSKAVQARTGSDRLPLGLLPRARSCPAQPACPVSQAGLPAGPRLSLPGPVVRE